MAKYDVRTTNDEVMAKIKLTKGELKKQRDSLKQYRRYLPTLQLKKQQLQMKILETRAILNKKLGVFFEKEKTIKEWVDLLGDSQVDLTEWLTPESVSVDTLNIAGTNIPVFDKIHFKKADIDFYTTPFWIDHGVQELRLLGMYLTEINIIKKQITILKQELRITTQRVNLFEKIKIPECLNNVRIIRIYLGDQQANAVGVSKVAKKKIEAKELEEVLV